MNEAVRDYLLERVEETRGQLEGTRRDYLTLGERLNTLAQDLDSYERTLEIETRGSENPYQRQQSAVLQFPRVEVEYRAAHPLTPSTPKPTKVGIVLDVIKTNPGLRASEIFKAIAPDALLTLTLNNVYGALSKLTLTRKVENRDGQYYPAESGVKESEATG